MVFGQVLGRRHSFGRRFIMARDPLPVITEIILIQESDFMSRPQISSQARTNFQKTETKRIRREGGIPATIYSKGEQSEAVSVPNIEVMQILKAGGRLSLIDLQIDGKSQKAHPVMFQVIQRNPITNQILHIDFHRVSMNEPIHAKVPVILVGESPGVKLGGIAEQMVNELDIKALPDHMPARIDIDISQMDIGDMIHVSDITIPEGAELVTQTVDIAAVSIRQPAAHLAAESEIAAEAEAAAAAAAATEAEKPE